MRIVVVTLFPEFVEHALGFGVLGRALERGVLKVTGKAAKSEARATVAKASVAKTPAKAAAKAPAKKPAATAKAAAKKK